MARFLTVLVVFCVLTLEFPCSGAEPSLRSRLAALAKAHKGKVAIAVKNLATGETCFLDADEAMAAAGLIHLPVMLETYLRADEGKLKLTDPVTLREAHKASAKGILGEHFSAGATFPLRDAVRIMIAFSDCTAMNMVLEKIEPAAVNQRLANWGMSQTRIHSKPVAHKNQNDRLDIGSTTAHEMIKLLEMLETGKIGRPAVKQALLGHLKSCVDRERFARFLPAETVLAHTTGTLHNVRNAAGILYLPNAAVVLCVLTTREEGPEMPNDSGNLACARVAQEVLDYYSRKHLLPPPELEKAPMTTRHGLTTWAWLGLALAGVTGALAEKPPQELPKSLTNSIGLELVLIPAGEFDIGTPDSAQYPQFPSEKPQHRVKITKPFYLGKFEVTQEQYEKVMGKNPSYFSRTGAYKDKVKDQDTHQFPVEGVSWDDAQVFCAKLSNLEAEKKAGRVYRLPTSAEWEYAYRAGTTTLFYSGDTVSFKNANFGAGTGGVANRPDVGVFGREEVGLTPPGRTTKVGSYAPNPWGLYDMHGNVLEWCQDYFDPDYYKLKVKEDPQGPKIGYAFEPQARVVRGGSWRLRSNYNRSACRFPSKQVAASPGEIGFRVVCVSAARAP